MKVVASTISDASLERKVRRCVRTLHLPAWGLSVVARDGHVRLTGPMLPEDLPRVLEAVGHLPGVQHVEHHLAEPAR
jgi:osmotically-inducible protein OsmY